MFSQEPYVILACTIYGEARGEYARLEGGLASLIAIGNVVMNRVNAKTWFGDDVISVCLKEHQFSCWNMTDPNRVVVEQANAHDPLFQLCLDVASCLCDARYPDLTKSSTHYHHYTIRPSWARALKPRVKIGRHVFYRAR